jgi:calcineurin-like phosphoesterase
MHMPQRFTVAQGPIRACGALFEIDPDAGKCLSVRRVTF